MTLKVGDLVLLHLNSPGSVGITPGLKKYKGKEFKIRRRRDVNVQSKSGTYIHYYELDGCVSDAGVPFGVTEDWITSLEEN